MLGRTSRLNKLGTALRDGLMGSNEGRALLDWVRQSRGLGDILALTGSLFKPREEDKVRLFLADFFSAEIVAIADNDNHPDGEGDGVAAGEPAAQQRESVARAKLRIDTRKWLMEQFAPQRYGSGGTATGRDRKVKSLFRTKLYLPDNGRH